MANQLKTKIIKELIMTHSKIKLNHTKVEIKHKIKLKSRNMTFIKE